MASRHEEKEARKQARLEAEREEARTTGRQRRVQLVAGGLAALVLVVGIVVLVLSGSGSGGDGGARRASDSGDVPALPAQTIDDGKQAAAAAKCTLTSSPIEGRGHEQRDFAATDYKTNPPTSGTHFPEWAEDGVYAPGNTPQLGRLVHTLEHGRIDVQYKPGTPAETVGQLEAFVAENDGYHMVMYQNQTDMDAQIAATAWGKSLRCDSVGDATWDALRTFRDANLDKGPELIP